MYLHYLEIKSRPFNILESNPAILKIAGGSEMTLYPTGDYTGKTPGIGKNLIAVFYKINQEQVEQLANHSVVNVKLNFISEEKYDGCLTNDDGTYYYWLPVEQGKHTEKFKEMAKCILDHK